MSFLNILLLGGASVFLAPLIIHLLNRSRFQSVDWGAMHLLEAAMQVNSRRLQWEAILLLILRCLIPMLFAFALARPVLTHLKVAGANGKEAIAIMIDNSLSMDATAVDGTTSLFHQAVAETTAVIESYRAAEISLWSSGGSPSNAVGGTTFDAARAKRSLQQIQAGAGASDPVASLLAGADQLTEMVNPNKQLLLVGDFQASYWGQLSAEQLDRVRERLSRGSQPIQLSLLPLTPNPSLGNVSVELRNPDNGLPAFVGETIRITAVVTNHGNGSIENLPVVLTVDGLALSSESIDLSPDTSEQVEFACQFESAGQHQLVVSIEDTSPVRGDDSASQVIHVAEAIRVLLIDPSLQRGAEAASGFLQLALAPFQSQNLFELRLDDRLGAAVLDDYDVVVLADVNRLNDQEAQHLIEFVRQGGGLVVLAGDRIDAGWYNQHWFEEMPLMPAIFEPLEEPAEQPVTFAKQVIQDPILAVFNGTEAGDLSEVSVRLWMRLAFKANSATQDDLPIGDTAATVERPMSLLQLSQGDWVMARQHFGEGMVVQSGLSMADDWSNLPLRPVFVPLAQRLILAATRRNKLVENYRTGEAIVLSPQDAKTQGFDQASPPLMTTPLGLSLPWQSSESNSWVFGNTTHAGVYQMLNGSQNRSSELINNRRSLSSPGKEGAHLMFAVQFDPRESNLGVLDTSALQELAEKLGGVVVSSAKEFATAEQQRRDGQEVWRWALFGLIACLFAEILLAQRITRGSHA